MLKLVRLIPILTLLWLTPQALAETHWVAGTIMKSQAPIRKDPHDLSEIIGNYPEGTSLILYYPKVNHFYAIYFKEPVQDHLKGWIHESQVFISTPNEPPFVPIIPLDPLAYRMDRPQAHFNVATLFNSLEYQQASLRPFKQDSLVGLIEGETPLYSPSFTLSAQLTYTLFPNSTNILGINARFFRSNIQLHYHWVQNPFLRISLMGGITYLTSSIPESAYGYRNFVVPRIYPSLEFVLRQRVSLRTLVSYMPFPKKGSEFLFDLTLFYHMMNGHALFTRLIYSEITFPESSLLRQNTQNTLQLGLGYQF